jgi:nucleoid DNA-binding protein
MTVSLSHYSQKQKKEARDLAVADLINSLKKLKSGESLRFGNLGTFEKTQRKVEIDQKPKNKLFKKFAGKTLIYYRLSFRASSLLKREIDK